MGQYIKEQFRRTLGPTANIKRSEKQVLVQLATLLIDSTILSDSTRMKCQD